MISSVASIPSMPGHAQVHHDHVGPAALGERDRRLAVRRLADDADVRRAQQREAEPFAHDLVVVCEQDGDLAEYPPRGDSTGTVRRGSAASAPGRGRSGGPAAGSRARARARRTRPVTGATSRPREVAAARVQLRVARALDGQSRASASRKCSLRARPQVEDVRPDVVRAGLAGRLHRLGELLRARRRGRAGSARSRRSCGCPRRRAGGRSRAAGAAAPCRARSSARRARRASAPRR